MTKNWVVIGAYVLALVASVVCVDVLFFKGSFWGRLVANILIVLVFTFGYFRFVRRG